MPSQVGFTEIVTNLESQLEHSRYIAGENLRLWGIEHDRAEELARYLAALQEAVADHITNKRGLDWEDNIMELDRALAESRR